MQLNEVKVVNIKDLSIANEPSSSIVNQANGIHEMTPILKPNP